MFSVVSHLDLSSKIIEYSVIPSSWIFESKNKKYFHYPPESITGTTLLKTVKQMVTPTTGWRKFVVRKIYHSNLSKFRGLGNMWMKEGIDSI